MADTAIEISAGSGTNIDTRTEGTNGNHRQVVVLGDPATNAGVAPVDATAGLKVDLGADNDVVLGAGTASIGKLAANSGVDIGDVDVTSCALPTGASTAAKQPALGTAGSASTDVITVQGIASMTPLLVDGSGATQPVSGTVSVTSLQTDALTDTQLRAAAVPVSLASVPSHAVTNAGTFATQATLQAGTAEIGKLAAGVAEIGNVKNSGTFATQATLQTGSNTIGAVNIAAAQTLATVTTVGTVTTLTGGAVAHDGADSGNPVKVGARAVNAEIAAVANNDRVDLLTDLVGKLIVLPYANPENFVSGCISSAMTGTTSTSLIAAPASGLRNYITQITVSNSHATVGTDILIQDGDGGTTLYVIPAASVYGGATVTFPTPLRQPTTATALYCANVTTGSSTKVSASGYKGA